MEQIRLLIVDDHQLFREGLAALLNAAQETAVVSQAGTGTEAIASKLTTFFQRGGQKDTAVAPFPDLTDQERELLNLIAQGLNNRDIATRLHISSKTVSNHISNIFSKLQVADRAQAIIKARDAGLGQQNS